MLAKTMEKLYRNDMVHDLRRRVINLDMHKQARPETDDAETNLQYARTDELLETLSSQTNELIEMLLDDETPMEACEAKNKDVNELLVEAKDVLGDILRKRGMGDIVDKAEAEAEERANNPMDAMMGGMNPLAGLFGGMFGGDESHDDEPWK